MKLKINLTILLLVLSFVVVVNNASAQSTTVDANTTATTPVVNTKVDARAKLNATIEQNKEMRKEIRDEKKGEIRDLRASSSVMIKDMRTERKEKMDDIRNSSSTRMEMKAEKTDLFKRMQGEKKEVLKTLKNDAFKTRKDALVKQLNMSLENLSNIRGRINDRIVKLESEGKVLTEAKASLSVADDKLAKAKVAVDALSAYTAPSTNGAAATTAEVELSKPRLIGDAAIKAVKEARDALKEVVKLVAKNTGTGVTASSTNSI